MLCACRPFLLLSLVLATALRAEKPELSTRAFKWPSDYLNRGWPFQDTDQTAAENSPTISFRGEVKALPPRKVVREFLENQGITFPEGSSATFNHISGLLTVTNTQSSLADVEALARSLAHQSPATIACTLTVIEGTGELIRQANAAASRTSNASQELATLLGYAKNPGSNVRIVGDAFLETKSGTRASTQAVREAHLCLRPPNGGKKADPPSFMTHARSAYCWNMNRTSVPMA